MKSWLLFILLAVAVILVPVLIQFRWTRRAMAEFAKQHGMTYKNPRKALFSIGKIRGTVNQADFFMGMLPTNYSLGPVAEMDYPQEKFPYMYIAVNGMPQKLVIRRRVTGRVGAIIDTLSKRTGIPKLKTGDAAFDAQIDVIGYENEALPWLTALRRQIIVNFLSKRDYVVTRGGLAYSTGKTHIKREDLEEAFAHLTAAQREL